MKETKKTPKERLREAVAVVRRIVTEPRSELNRWERRARFAYDLGRYGAKKLRRDAAPQMAAALSYRTLFGLLPVLVVGTMVVRATGGFALFRDRIATYLGSLGLDGVRISSTDPESGQTALGQSLSSWVLSLLDEAEHIDLTAITWVGVAVLVYSALSLMVTIENSFNAIYRAPGGRPWTRRVPIYWTLLTLGPVAIAGTIYLSNQLDRYVGVLSPISGFLGTWLFMSVVYKWIPNTHVRFRAAIVGALVATILLEGGKAFLGAYIGNAFSVRYLYGSLGLIPLFMFWVYAMWLIVLFGVEVSAALQKFTGGVVEDELDARASQRITEPGAIVAVMGVVAERFTDGEPTSSRDVADALGIEERTVGVMLEALVEARLLHRIDGNYEAFAPAVPLRSLGVDRLLDVGFSLADELPAGRVPLLDELRAVQRELAKKTTLAALVPAPEER